MISDKNITKISIIIAVIGIILLYIFIQFIEPIHMNIHEITRDDIGQQIMVSGYITNMNEKDSHYFFTLIEEPEMSYGIKTVLFANTAKNLDTSVLGNGEFITVHGEIALYENELEIIVKNIE